MDMIIGRPENEFDYEFMVVVPIGNGQYQWVADYEDGWEAEAKAIQIGGLVAHDLGIAHKRKKVSK